MAALNYFVIDRVETGNRIYAYRKGMHLSRERLADILSEMDVWVSINSIGKWERGEVDISFDYAQALSKVFGCKLYGELVVFHLRDLEDEHDQPVPFLNLINFVEANLCNPARIRLFLFCKLTAYGTNAIGMMKYYGC